MIDKDNNFIIAGYGKGSKKTRIPIEAPEGILTGQGTGLALSKTQIKVLDLLSEGQILGLSTGEYKYEGTLGSIGWDSVTFIPNKSAIGTNIKWLQSIFWNDIPVASKEGKFNFQQIAITGSKGYPNGSNIYDSLLDELTTTRIISERLRGGGDEFSKTYRIVDKNCIGANINIRINQLSRTSTNSKTLGDILIDSIDYSIYYRPVFSVSQMGDFIFAKKENIKGKINAGYIRSTRIDFDQKYTNQDDLLGWEIKITRWTEDSTTSTVRNQSFVDSLTEIYGAKFVYPNSAIISSLFDSEFFGNIPNRTYKVQLLKVKVPSNYNPIYKTYDETVPWSGTFKTDDNANILKEWTDNPVWCYYDLLTNKRYGLGNYIDEDYIDKFTLYDISKYCDTLVSDGYGGLEPRFTCNLYINSPEEAYKVINSMASIFRGITYYSAGQIYTSIDSEKSPVYQFTNANVLDGDFNYSSSARKARHSVAIVRYNDKRDNYKPSLEYVEDIDAIRKYGIREVEVPAYGCTSRGQAIRLGRWALLTENLETESIKFRAGIEVAGPLKPGDIFQVYNSHRNNYRLGGRLYNISVSPSSTTLTLDSEITGFNANTTYKLSLLTPTYYYDPSLVTGLSSADISGIRRSHLQYITFSGNDITAISGRTVISNSQTIDYTNYHVSGNPVWMIEATGTNILGDIKADEWETYRVINIKESEPHIYDIEGLEYNVAKFQQIESGFNFTDEPYTALVFNSPSGLQLNLRTPKISPNSELIDYKFLITHNSGIQSYRVLAKTSPFLANDENSGEYIIDNLPRDLYSGSYLPFSNGTYYFRVYSVGRDGNLSSNYASNSIVIENINPIQDITISSLQLDSGSLATNNPSERWIGNYSEESPTFVWQVGLNGFNNIPTDLNYRITIRKPSTSNIPDQEIYYEKTGYINQNSEYTFNFQDNYNAISRLNRTDGPFRDYDIVVEAMTSGGFSSAGGRFDPNPSAYVDAKYNNPNGYDIFYASNPQPLSRPLYTGRSTDNFYNTGYASQQWITQDGEIKIFLSRSGDIVEPSGFYGDDIAGATLYYSDYPFQVLQGQSLPPEVSTIQISTADNPIIAPVGLYNTNSQYISLSPYDSFDVAHSELISNYLVTGISTSNVIRITKAGSSTSYKAWVEFDIGWINGPYTNWGLLKNWRSRSYNVADVSTETVFDPGFGNRNLTKIVFEEPLETNAYAVQINQYQASDIGGFPNGPIESVCNVYKKDTSHVLLTPASDLFVNLKEYYSWLGHHVTGRCFVGILSNN